MPLITCPDCGRAHSDAAAACPQCGRPHAVPYVPHPNTAMEVSRGIRRREAAHAMSSVVMVVALLFGLLAMALGGVVVGVVVVLTGLVAGSIVKWKA